MLFSGSIIISFRQLHSVCFSSQSGLPEEALAYISFKGVNSLPTAAIDLVWKTDKTGHRSVSKVKHMVSLKLSLLCI